MICFHCFKYMERTETMCDVPSYGIHYRQATETQVSQKHTSFRPILTFLCSCVFVLRPQ